MNIFYTILFALCFGSGLYLAADSINVLRTAHPCRVTYFKKGGVTVQHIKAHGNNDCFDRQYYPAEEEKQITPAGKNYLCFVENNNPTIYEMTKADVNNQMWLGFILLAIGILPYFMGDSYNSDIACRSCGKKKVITSQVQTRAGDEEPTTFATCMACRTKWRME
jgi:hypothetical protein